MTVEQLAKELDLTPAAGVDELDREVTGGYCGDLLSWVMGRAQEGDAWITVMGNLNAIAVAVLADTACIILAEDAALDEDAKQRADQQGVPVLKSSRHSYELAVALSKCLG
jgi:predicted transcriptional regulator